MLLIHTQLPGSRTNEEECPGNGDQSPEVALCVLLKLLPVEPVLVRPHPHFNLAAVFSHFCLFVCSAGTTGLGGWASVWRESFPGRIVFARTKPEKSHTDPCFVVYRTKQQAAVVLCLLLKEGCDSCTLFSVFNCKPLS